MFFSDSCVREGFVYFIHNTKLAFDGRRALATDDTAFAHIRTHISPLSMYFS